MFVEDGCPYCLIYKLFLPRLMSNIPIEKRIKIVDCTLFQNYGIVTDPLILVFDKYIEGYPCLFLNGVRYSGVNTKREIEAYLKALLNKDFEIPVKNEHLFNKDCKYVERKYFGKKLFCR
ncbi:MAG: hypothetical protein ACFFG0_48460 [Candidatus Thorarchaeota archaeon]